MTCVSGLIRFGLPHNSEILTDRCKSSAKESKAMPSPNVAPDEALERLMAGNIRYSDGNPQRPHQDAMRRIEVADAQTPFAIVVGCSDSRVPIEVIFDVGVGDLFVIRTAGNLIEDVGIASAEFAVSHLAVGLIAVVGHMRCGAVQAAVDATLIAENLYPTGNIGSDDMESQSLIHALVAKIQPAVDAVRHDPGDLVENATRANARAVARRLSSRSTILSDAVRAGELKIVSSVYDLDTGCVELLAKSHVA